MRKGNGKSDVDVDRMDLEHELPPAEDDTSDEIPQGERQEQPAPANIYEEELRKARAERDVLYDRLARVQAETENLRKRAAREQSDFKEYAVADVMKSLLPILDSFDRALETHGGDENFRGVELINRQMHDTLTKLGLRPIPAQGEVFDPHLHQAIQMVDTSDVEDNRIIEELQRGYKFKDRLLRPAMVRVARNPNKSR
jgi:molecular chaperone GrpE